MRFSQHMMSATVNVMGNTTDSLLNLHAEERQVIQIQHDLISKMAIIQGQNLRRFLITVHSCSQPSLLEAILAA